MTATDIIREVESAGGVLALNGDRIRYELPEAAASLVDVMRQHRDEVLHVLRGRQNATKLQISRWMAARCMSSRRVWGGEKSLYRDLTAWCQQCNETPCPRELFRETLNQCFDREADGWQGIALAIDFAASRYIM